MIQPRLLFLLSAFFFFLSCKNSQLKNLETMKPLDPHSCYSQSDVLVNHLSLNLEVDFSKKELRGSALWKIQNPNGGNKIFFDTKRLHVEKVLLDNKEKATFRMGADKPYLGQALEIDIHPATKTVTIFYTTSPDAAAIQWLEPGQTAGKKRPFLFTQSQAILARTWVPCQDSPGIRFTYDAVIKVPNDLLALMSAENPKEKNPQGVYMFNMPQPVPSYLLALSVGDLEFKSFDDRTGIYAEPATLAKAAYEFVDLPKMVDAAEKLYGPYAWGQYDLLILPPSFPFGGMENPRLTFATPTILAGDRSLTSLVAHELAHSWSGNLVTNATWNDFWLNEGFTVYFENRIMEALYGKDVADMQRILGQESLKETIKELGDTSADTHLYLNLEGRDPDDGVSDIAYEKGNNLLLVIEQAIGREKFDAFLNYYFKKYSFQTITTEKFLTEYRDVIIKGDSALAAKINIDKWIYSPGLPENYVHISSRLFDEVDKTVAAWKAGKKASELDTKNYSTNEWLRFLNTLHDLSPAQMKELDAAFHFTRSGNSEILFVWFELSINSHYETAFPAMEEFLTNVGRRKFVKPLFIALVRTPEGKALAEKIYSKAKANYHSVTRSTVEEILAKEVPVETH
jgi:leukotriene-A4 hydrolase